MVLDLPEPDTTQLPGSPLELVVCEIRFESKSDVNAPATALEFHEEIGGSDGLFNRLEPVQQQTLTMVMGAQAPNIDSQGVTGWRFLSEAGDWTVSLMPDHVALET